MAPPATSILEVIESGRWRRATFTTFTLSLTYFECYILPRLRAQGCSSITIYVDALGYRDSLTEQRSRYVGREYSVHPVVVKGGIFHPKLVHLWPESGDDDVLLVGSGNLTYAGHGGSVEVFEALRPSLHAHAFGQAGEFFEALVSAHDRIHIMGDTVPLNALATRFSRFSASFANVQDVAFLHSLSRSGLAQLSSSLAGGAYDSLLVVSPYHHPEGAPVRALVDATAPARVHVCQDRLLGTSPFPFELASSWPIVPSAVVLDENKRRPIHAKWFEWRSARGTSTFTGSFNATHESLATINNVEAGVLRHNATTRVNWVEDDPLPFATQTFPRTGAAGALLVTGALTGRDLTGTVFGAAFPLAGRWSFQLEGEHLGGSAQQSVEVDRNGRFELRLDFAPDLGDDAGIQVRLESPGAVARGWIAMPQFLTLGARQRTLLSALSDVRTGAETADGFGVVLTIVMEEISAFSTDFAQQRNATAPSSGAQAGASAGAGRDGQRTGSSAREPTVAPRDRVTDGPDRQCGDDNDRLMAAFADGLGGLPLAQRIASVLMGSADTASASVAGAAGGAGERAKGRASLPPIAPPSVDEEGDEAPDQKAQKKLRELLNLFELLIERCSSALRERLAGQVTPEDLAHYRVSLYLLERTWLHVMLRAHTGPLQSVPAAVVCLGEWLHRIVDMDFGPEPPTELVRDVSGCAAVLAYHNHAGPDALMQCVASSRPPDKVMRSVQYLEAFYGGEPVRDVVLNDAGEWLNSQVGQALVKEPQHAVDALARALLAPTPRSMVASYIAKPQLRADSRNWASINDAMRMRLSRGVLTVNQRAALRAVDVRRVCACPLCHRDLRVTVPGRDDRQPDPSMLAELKVWCVSECRHCRGVLVNDIVEGRKNANS